MDKAIRGALFLLLSLSAPCLAQFTAGTVTGRNINVPLRLMIVLEGHKEPYNKEVTVAVYDGWGNAQIVRTTTTGFIDFSVSDELHRLRVFGPEIEPYFDEFTVGQGGEMLRTIEVHPRRSNEPRPATAADIPVVRMNIPRGARAEFDKARRAWKEKKVPEAEQHLRKAIAKYAAYDEAYAALGQLELARGDVEHGRADLATALKLNPNNVAAARRLAEVFIAAGDYVSAEPLLLPVLRNEPSNQWALVYAAWGELEQHNYDKAIANAQKAVSGPHQAYEGAHLIAARALELSGHIAEARAACESYLKEAPQGGDVAEARKILVRLDAASKPTSH